MVIQQGLPLRLGQWDPYCTQRGPCTLGPAAGFCNRMPSYCWNRSRHLGQFKHAIYGGTHGPPGSLRAAPAAPSTNAIPRLDRARFPVLGFRSCSKELQESSARARPPWRRTSPRFSATRPITNRSPGAAGVLLSAFCSCPFFIPVLSPWRRNGRAFAAPMGRGSARQPISPSNGLPMTTTGRSTCQ